MDQTPKGETKMSNYPADTRMLDQRFIYGNDPKSKVPDPEGAALRDTKKDPWAEFLESPIKSITSWFGDTTVLGTGWSVETKDGELTVATGPGVESGGKTPWSKIPPWAYLAVGGVVLWAIVRR